MQPKQYISYTIAETDSGKQEVLVALLQDFGFHGFEQTDTSLVASGYKEHLDENGVDSCLLESGVFFSKAILEEENWNKLWESDFHPIIIGDFCAVRAGFHAPITHVAHEIIITPKMSFGTGHHATTWMMLKAMQSIDFKKKSVIDFGTGTGVLAILAEKMGASTIVAIDCDDWCIENGRENVEANNCERINIIKANHPNAAGKADVILANINKNIILAALKDFSTILNENGILLISGILKDDIADIVYSGGEAGLKMVKSTERNGWLCLAFTDAAWRSLINY
ncbi:MAG: 50S ribosomal protein L11 methyltransferase [Chitinophagaceae bacterium]